MKKEVLFAAALLAASAACAQTYQMRVVSLGLVGPISAISVSSPTAFPLTPRNTPAAPQVLTVTNNGNVPASVSAATITTGNADFSATLGAGCQGIPAGSTQCTISIGFTPTLAGTRTGVLTVTSNAATAVAPLALSGEGSGPTAYVLRDGFEGTTTLTTAGSPTLSYGTFQPYEGLQYRKADGGSGVTFGFRLPMPANATNGLFTIRQALTKASSYTRTLYRTGCPLTRDNATIGKGGAYAGFTGSLNWGTVTLTSSDLLPGCQHYLRWDFGTDPGLPTAGFAFDDATFSYTLN